jgi:predicted adenylyl cyclase CyaB
MSEIISYYRVRDKEMALNIEIKARLRDLERLTAQVASMADGPGQVIRQHDVFFLLPRGRLKLRVLGPSLGQLVYYEREDDLGPKLSGYLISVTHEPDSLERVLSAALGVRGVVDKVRHLYRVGQTRVHLDTVIGLGEFIELEVVLGPGQSQRDGERIAGQLMERLGIHEDDLIDVAYIDLLEAQQSKESSSEAPGKGR